MKRRAEQNDVKKRRVEVPMCDEYGCSLIEGHGWYCRRRADCCICSKKGLFWIPLHEIFLVCCIECRPHGYPFHFGPDVVPPERLRDQLRKAGDDWLRVDALRECWFPLPALKRVARYLGIKYVIWG